MLESILVTRRHNIADGEIIKEQFRYLVSPTEGHYILKNLRKAMGGANVYPAIEAFVEDLEKESSALPQGKRKIA
jgi:hypothetical protein